MPKKNTCIKVAIVVVSAKSLWLMPEIQDKKLSKNLTDMVLSLKGCHVLLLQNPKQTKEFVKSKVC
jgi:hypothetical protein